MYLPLEFLLPLLLFVFAQILLLDLLLYESLHLDDLLAVALPRLLYIIDLLLQDFQALVLSAVLQVGFLGEGFGLDLHELADALRDKVLGVELLLEHADLLLQVLLLLVKDARLASELAQGLTLAVLDLQVLVRLSLVHSLLQTEDLLVVFIRLLRILVLCFFEVFVEFFDFEVEILLFVAEA